MTITQAATWLFSGSPERGPWWKIVAWWELRRVPYNLIVGIVGTPCLLLFYLFVFLADELRPGEDAVEQMALFAAPFLINIAYTAGWIGELFLKVFWKQESPVIGPALFKLGLSFSLGCLVVPPFLWFVVWIT